MAQSWGNVRRRHPESLNPDISAPLMSPRRKLHPPLKFSPLQEVMSRGMVAAVVSVAGSAMLTATPKDMLNVYNAFFMVSDEFKNELRTNIRKNG
jgi:hypothetical protein